MNEERIKSFAEFWPYYLSEHRNPTCRILHFVGTSGFFAAFVCGLIFLTQQTLLAFGMVAVVNALASKYIEPIRPPRRLFLVTTLGAMVIAPQVFIPGVIWAYGFAWVGHFKVENNRPATFEYPAWSLLGDFRMYGMMTMGRLWSGDSLATTDA